MKVRGQFITVIYFLHKLRSYGKVHRKVRKGTIGSKVLTHFQSYSLKSSLYTLDSYLNFRLLRD